MAKSRFLGKRLPAIQQLLVFVLVNRIRCLAVFDFAKVDDFVRSFNHQVNLSNEVVTKQFVDNGQLIEREVELFTWEKLDKVEAIRKAFGI